MARPRLPVYSTGGAQPDRMSMTIYYKFTEQTGAKQKTKTVYVESYSFVSQHFTKPESGAKNILIVYYVVIYW